MEKLHVSGTKAKDIVTVLYINFQYIAIFTIAYFHLNGNSLLAYKHEFSIKVSNFFQAREDPAKVCHFSSQRQIYQATRNRLCDLLN